MEFKHYLTMNVANSHVEIQKAMTVANWPPKADSREAEWGTQVDGIGDL